MPLLSRGDELSPGFHPHAPFAEQVRWSTLPDGVRVFVNCPLPRQSATVVRPRRLILFATPNGNTIEQTLGCARAEGRDWHFDIQHVAAQVRQYREWSHEQEVLLAVVQAPQQSWPAYCRATANASHRLRELVESLRVELRAERVDLVAHSGGGSFLFSWIDAHESLPSTTERIVFLDANYAFSAPQHGRKLSTWLHSASSHRLVVVAYDDREITLNGKKVVGPDGGTFRASRRMLDSLALEYPLTESQEKPSFNRHRGLDGQIDFWIHPNPQNKILHTALVGDMNGLMHGLTLGDKRAGEWGTFGGPRSYEKWISPSPMQPVEVTGTTVGWRSVGVSQRMSTELAQQPPVSLAIPPRRAEAESGTRCRDHFLSMTRVEREAAVMQQVSEGNVPSSCHRLIPLQIAAVDAEGDPHTATVFVAADYIGVGGDDDFLRMPLSPAAAWRIATAANATLPTRKLVHDIWNASDIRLAPRPLTQDRESVVSFYEHQRAIEAQRREKPKGALIAGIKKDVVWSSRLLEKPNKVAIFGWHQLDGVPIQPLYVGHIAGYVDYSHGVRLVAERCWVDGQEMRVTELLRDPLRCGLLSDEGPLDTVRLAEQWTTF